MEKIMSNQNNDSQTSNTQNQQSTSTTSSTESTCKPLETKLPPDAHDFRAMKSERTIFNESTETKKSDD